MNLTYFVNSLIIVIIILYNIFIIEFYDFENFIMKFIIIFLKSFFEIENN